MRIRFSAFLIFTSVFSTACSQCGDTLDPDGGNVDSLVDSGDGNLGMTDAGMTDAGMTDAGMTDAGMTDAGMTDAGMTDAGMTDAGMTDAGSLDVCSSDADCDDAHCIGGSCFTGDALFIKSSNTGRGNNFGENVAIDGDTLAVASLMQGPCPDGLGNNSECDRAGAIYIFERTGINWQQTAILRASNTSPDRVDEFGASLSLEGNRLVVGAPWERGCSSGVDGDDTDFGVGNACEQTGAAFVFEREGAIWSQTAYLKASNPNPVSKFGESVSLSGSKVVVGAPGEKSCSTGINGLESNTDCSGAGAAYVFEQTDSSWSQTAYVKASNTNASDQFGRSIALDGDAFVVGASNEDSCATGVNGSWADNTCGNSGAAYVFELSGDTWTQAAYVKASNTDANDRFGFTVTLSGDTLFILSLNEASCLGGDENDNTCIYTGAVYVYSRTDTTWNQTALLKAKNEETVGEYGLVFDGQTLFVGATANASCSGGIGISQPDDDSCGSSGAVLTFEHDGENWFETNIIKAIAPGDIDRFGHSIASDGEGTLVVGARGEDSCSIGISEGMGPSGCYNAGAVYIFGD